MINRRLTLLALCLPLAVAGCARALTPTAVRDGSASALGGAAEARSEVVVSFDDRAQLDALAKAGVDLFENVDLTKRTVGATLTPRTEAVVRRLGARYRVVQALGRKSPLPAGYRTVERVGAELRALAAAHPKIMRLEVIGKSVETEAGKADRPVWGVRFTSKPDARLPNVRITAGQHSRELPPVELAMRLVAHLAENYGKDAEVTRLIDTREIWIVPLVNPDGRARVEAGETMWRKNARPLARSVGVDVNRNGDDHFEQGNGNPRDDDYKGPAPFSEPESRAIRDLSARRPFAVSLDVHCYAGMVLWPPGFTRDQSVDEPHFRRIGGAMADRIGYRAGTIARTIYQTFGDLATWEYNTHGTLAFAAELKDPGFRPPFAQVEKDWQDWLPNFLYLIDAAASPRGEKAPGLLGFAGVR